MLKSVMMHQFSQVPWSDIPRSRFDRSCGYKTTFDSGYLIPFFVDEVLPGDTFDVNATLFARLSTQVVPIMDNIFLDTFFFFVPLRLIWDNFQKFMGEQKNPGDSIDFLTPQINAPSGGFQPLSLFDYMGIPTGVSNISILSFYARAYNLIWNEWFRDENLQDSAEVPLGDGPDLPSLFPLRKRGKRHDYFTSALPWPQKGPGVELPLGTYAPVYGNGKRVPFVIPSNDNTVRGLALRQSGQSGAGASSSVVFTNNYSSNSQIDLTATGNLYYPTKAQSVSVGLSGADAPMFADLTEATAATINSLRQAFALQRFQEKWARGGTRYTEILRSFFGVISPDARLQRPEYLGGSSNRMQINTVPQTSGTTSESPQANLAAYGTFSSTGNGFVKSFVEHGVVIGLINARADLTYQQGIDRIFSRRTRYDYYWPTFAHLGEQEILNKEIYAQGTSADDAVFGYQERYAEYRYKPSKITGKFRSSDAQSLDVWHLAQDFTSLPTLSSSFIEDNPPIKRVLAVQDEPEFLLDAYINNVSIRPMPVYSVPGLIDHF